MSFIMVFDLDESTTKLSGWLIAAFVLLVFNLYVLAHCYESVPSTGGATRFFFLHSDPEYADHLI